MAGQVYHIIPDAARFQEWKYLSPVSSEYTATPLAKAATPFKVGACMIGASVTDEELDALAPWSSRAQEACQREKAE